MSKEEAQRIYREAWTEYALAQDEERKMQLESIMDGVQGECVTRNEKPCMPRGAYNPAMEEWKVFEATLPGYVEFWSMLDDDFDKLKKLVAERVAEATE